ncbi:MAG: hypothetical protein DRP67_00470 [Candidatus Omnitrophota bacterium]|nr:MAG: hypothetical protein DRP67_00470 [Candidatus Omnitrophota bacterium]
MLLRNILKIFLIFWAVNIYCGGNLPPLSDLLNSLKNKKHPYLLFEDIKSTPGWKNEKRRSWVLNRTFVPTVRRLYLKTNFASPGKREYGKASAAAQLGFAYLLTGEKQFLNKCKEALLNIGKGWIAPPEWGAFNGYALQGYALAYDFIANELSEKEKKIVEEALAKFADKVYQAIPKWDNPWHHAAGGVGLGMVALVIPDYKGDTKSKPIDWFRAATEYLFISNPYQPKELILTTKYEKNLKKVVFEESKPRAGINRTVDLGGYERRGGYRFEWVPSLVHWAVIYSHVFKRNALDDFPILRKYMNYIVWEMMPNGQGTTANMGDGRRWYYTKAVLHLLTPEERNAHIFYLTNFPKQRYDLHLISESVQFSLPQYNTDLGKGSPPSWTTFISPSAEHAVFRSSWKPTATWLFLNVYNYYIPRAREFLHHDNMSFQYYSHGDYLLMDCGEVRGRMYGYGPTGAVGHNLILVDGSGPVKGIRKFVDPAYMETYMISPWLDMVKAVMDYTHREDENQKYEHLVPLSAPVKWERIIFFPGREYIVILDRLSSEKSHHYEWLFHLSSLNIVPTKNKHDPGYVIGELIINNKKVDWAKDVKKSPLRAKREGDEYAHWASPCEDVGEFTAGEIMWKTTSIPTWKYDTYPYYIKHKTFPSEIRYFDLKERKYKTKKVEKRKVKMRMVFGPEKKYRIKVQRTWGINNFRDIRYEVDHPLLRIPQDGKNAHLFTLLLTQYENEDKYKVEKMKDGICVITPSYKDIFLLKNTKQIKGDWEAGMVREGKGNLVTCFFLNAKEFSYKGKPIFSLKEKALHIGLNYSEDKINIDIHTGEKNSLTVNCINFSPKKVIYTPLPEDWIWKKEILEKKYAPKEIKFARTSMNGRTIKFSVPEGKGKFTIVK